MTVLPNISTSLFAMRLLVVTVLPAIFASLPTVRYSAVIKLPPTVRFDEMSILCDTFRVFDVILFVTILPEISAFPDTVRLLEVSIFPVITAPPATVKLFDVVIFPVITVLPVMDTSLPTLTFPSISKLLVTSPPISKLLPIIRLFEKFTLPITSKSPLIKVLPVTPKTFEPLSSTYKFEPTSRVCVGTDFKIPTLL